jgi:ATP-dependent RNA helicase RhlB
MHCGMLSGSMPQSKREKTLEAFRNGDISVVVATDVAGRGLHVEGIELVVNYNIPHDAEDYVHRIGRTGRAGAEGVSVSFACESDSFYIPDIEELMGRTLDCERPPEEWLEQPPEQRKRRRSSRRRGGRGRGGQRGKKQN